jgi:hypothetical protein
MTISIKNCDQETTNKAITAMRRGQKKKRWLVIQLKRIENHVKKTNKYLKKMYTNVKDEAHGETIRNQKCH